jgi:hypothetical protein
MAYEETLRAITLDADASIGIYTGPPGVVGSAAPNYGKQYSFVTVTGSHTAGLASAAGDAVGVLQNKPQGVGNGATVAVAGISMVFAGSGGLTAGSEVEADANGHAVAKTAGIGLGVAIEGAAAGELCPVLLRMN